MEMLYDFNTRRRVEYLVRAATRRSTGPQLNGLACPKCNAEMFDTCPNSTLMSDPPQKNVHCQCGFTGYRVA